MTLNLRTNLAGLLVLLAALPIFASNIAIIESQSFHPLQTMDIAWKTIADGMGFQSDILPQSTLENINNLDNYDVLIVSSGLISTTDNQKATIEAFVQSGRNAYIQSEFAITHSGNVTFAQIVNNNGGSFQWLGAVSGSVAPVTVLAPFNEGSGSVDALYYFWYGTYGNGDETVIPFLEAQDKYWGFVFNSPDQNHGLSITTADQDWIRIRHNDMLLENILFQLTSEPVVITPTVLIDQTVTPSCTGEDFEFTAVITDAVPEITLQWQINGQPVPGANQTIYTTSDLLDSDVVECLLTLNNNNQNYQHLSNPILIAPVTPLSEVSIEITASELTTCANETIILTATGENWGDQPQFSWMVDGVIIPNQSNPVFTTTATASQNITCLVNSNADCTIAATATSNNIIINTISTTVPTINITADQTEICENTEVTFIATGDNWNATSEIKWFSNGVLLSNTPTFSTTLLENQQSITATISQTNECGQPLNISATATPLTVIESVLPTVTIAANSSQACPGEVVTYTATGSHWGEAPQLKWMVNGNTISTTASAEFVYDHSTVTQVVSCELISNESCVAENNILSNSITVSSYPAGAPTITINSDNSFVCNESIVNFSAVGDHWGASPSFEWIVNGTIVNTSAAFYSAANLQTGDQVSCRLTTNNACLGITTLTSNAIAIESSNFNLELLEKSDATCGENNGLIEFTTNGGLAPYRIQWDDGSTENFKSDLAPGSYRIFAIDANGCTTELTVNIERKTTPVIENLTIENATCIGSLGQATIEMADPSEAYSYRWVNEQNFILSDSTRLDARAGDYTLIVSDPTGCTTEQRFTIIETVEITAEIITDTIISLGDEAVLSLDVFANSPVTIAWKDSVSLSCHDCFETAALPTESTVFTAVLTSQEGCQIEVSQVVKVEKTKNIHIPNAFSPNGDGENDYFTVFGGQSYVRSIKSLQVFNRWGAKIFSKTNMDINDEVQGWNGKTGAVENDMGVYIYVAEIEFIDGETTMMTGDVSLIK